VDHFKEGPGCREASRPAGTKKAAEWLLLWAQLGSNQRSPDYESGSLIAAMSASLIHPKNRNWLCRESTLCTYSTTILHVPYN